MRENGRRLAVCLMLVLMAGVFVACSRNQGVEAARDDQTTVSPAEQDFMMKASQANQAEIDAARVAMHKTDNTDVRDYANMIESDHTRALEDLADLMKDKNVSQPKSEPQQAQQDISRMNNLGGPEFDREFVNMMVTDHQKAVEMFQDMQRIAQHSDVKKYVDDALPKLEMHLDKGRQLQSKLFSGSGRSSTR